MMESCSSRFHQASYSNASGPLAGLLTAAAAEWAPLPRIRCSSRSASDLAQGGHIQDVHCIDDSVLKGLSQGLSNNRPSLECRGAPCGVS